MGIGTARQIDKLGCQFIANVPDFARMSAFEIILALSK